MSTRALLHVAGIGATAFKAELILTVRTLDVIAHYRFSPNLLAMSALLGFAACDKLFDFLLVGFSPSSSKYSAQRWSISLK